MPKKTVNRKYKKVKNTYKHLLSIVFTIIILAVSYFLDTNYKIFTNLINPPNTNPPVTNAENELVIHFLDVGQGDCIIIQLPDGKNMIIDGGNNYNAVKSHILNFLNTYNITVFDYLMLTHTDADHVGSLDDVILNTDVKRVYIPEVSTQTITTGVYSDFVTAVQNEGLAEGDIKTTVMGDSIQSDAGYEIVFFTPLTSMHSEVKSGNAEKINAVSPIIILYYGGKSVMFTGDATSSSEALFLETIAVHSTLKNRNVDVDILKVAHHGSKTSSTTAFLNAVKPEISVISVGNNNYGHPETELIERLSNYSDLILRTDEKGDISIKLIPDSNGNAQIVLQDENTDNNVPNQIKFDRNLFANIKIVLPQFYEKSVYNSFSQNSGFLENFVSFWLKLK